jgi:hypothetical protein
MVVIEGSPSLRYQDGINLPKEDDQNMTDQPLSLHKFSLKFLLIVHPALFGAQLCC